MNLGVSLDTIHHAKTIHDTRCEHTKKNVSLYDAYINEASFWCEHTLRMLAE
jgi:hypothetical protein